MSVPTSESVRRRRLGNIMLKRGFGLGPGILYRERSRKTAGYKSRVRCSSCAGNVAVNAKRDVCVKCHGHYYSK